MEEEITLEAGNDPLNLTGYTVLASIWRDEKRKVKIADLQVVYVDRPNGVIKLRLPHTVTRLVVNNGYWDMLVIEPSGDRDYWLEGPADLDYGVTDDQ